MPALTRRRSTDAREECWHIYYGDVHAGTIAIRTGIPHDEDPWGWSCGFYPGSHPGNARAAWRLPSTRPAPISRPRGALVGRSDRKPIFSVARSAGLDRREVSSV